MRRSLTPAGFHLLTIPWGSRRDALRGKLREVDVLVQQGQTVREAVKRIGVSDHTYYVWRKEYSGMGVEQVKRLRDLEKENVRSTTGTTTTALSYTLPAICLLTTTPLLATLNTCQSLNDNYSTPSAGRRSSIRWSWQVSWASRARRSTAP